MTSNASISSTTSPSCTASPIKSRGNITLKKIKNKNKLKNKLGGD
jgi:hypothetical protein